MIRIGNQTAYSAGAPELPFEFALANGFDAFEWFPDRNEGGVGWTEDDLGPEQRERIRARAVEGNLRLSVHAPWWVNPVEPGAKEVVGKSIALARDLGASLLNIHLTADRGIGAFVEAILPILDRLAPLGIQLAVENTPLTGPGLFNELFRALADEHGLRHEVGMCLDYGHANLCLETLNDTWRFTDLLDPGVPIIHVHLHENYGDRDQHLPVFTGPSRTNPDGIRGFLDRLIQRNFQGAIILEQWPDPPTLLVEARNRLLELLAEPPRGNTATRPPQATSGPCTVAPEPASRPPDDFVGILAEADRNLRSWREKLDWIDAFLAHSEGPIPTETLAALAVYLRFLGTGAIPCREDGRHFRPSHHALLSRDITRKLSAGATEDDRFLLRKILPYLPSFRAAFTRAEPLTLIRDIAHRNDIPKELKAEIKHSLQNKLHRCAGPEDLETSAALLARITAPGAPYPPDFVSQFRRFHEQLEEFFNARALDERLAALAQTGDEKTRLAVASFLDSKAQADRPNRVLPALRELTALRRRFSEIVPTQPADSAHEILVADVQLEDLAFVLLSRFIALLEKTLPSLPREEALEGLILTIGNLSLSGIETGETAALARELTAWMRDWDPPDSRRMLRLKASLERAGRLAERFADRMLGLLPETAERLGRALGVVRHAVEVFCEAEIRGHLVFQLSKLVTLLLGEVRRRTGDTSPWEVIVPGRVAGILADLGTPDASPHSRQQPLIALMERIEGDEDIPPGVTGILVGRETLLLSHFAVRCRQGKVVLASCREPGPFNEIKGLAGRPVTLDATPEGVRVQPVSSLDERDSAPARPMHPGSARAISIVQRSASPRLLPLSQIRSATAGSKANNLRRLQECSVRSGKEPLFHVPDALALPFGAMEAVLRQDPSRSAAYGELVERLEEAPEADYPGLLQELRHLLSGLEVPASLIAPAAASFAPDTRLAVRSSSNCEDLPGISGAGLYESFLNVTPSALGKAIAEVWASLWTDRAALSRRHLGIPHAEALMAVLIQELVVPDYSFIIHTVDPIRGQPEEALVEVAAGLGEVLASGCVPGHPYRFIGNKMTGVVRWLAHASYSTGLWPLADGGTEARTLDYSTLRLSTDETFARSLGTRLTAVARCVEEAFGGPQDMEGAVCGEMIYLVQSRPQQGGA